MMNKKVLMAVVIILAFGAVVTVANASHKWSKYHWDISTEQSLVSPLELGNNLTTSAWITSLTGASSDWNVSVLKNQVVAGNKPTCDPTLGAVEICNAEYGNNGWLGIAQVWIYRGRSGHIAQALVKVNDTYFGLPKYDTPTWRDVVMCQEIGHTLGLSHVDENFDNVSQGTCMDYTANPGEADRHPNQHDYDMLEAIYTHLNGTDDGGTNPGKGNGRGKNKSEEVRADTDLNNPSEWGQSIREDAQGNPSLYVRDLGNGQEVFTFVIWAQ